MKIEKINPNTYNYLLNKTALSDFQNNGFQLLKFQYFLEKNDYKIQNFNKKNKIC